MPSLHVSIPRYTEAVSFNLEGETRLAQLTREFAENTVTYVAPSGLTFTVWVGNDHWIHVLIHDRMFCLRRWLDRPFIGLVEGCFIPSDFHL